MEEGLPDTSVPSLQRAESRVKALVKILETGEALQSHSRDHRSTPSPASSSESDAISGWPLDEKTSATELTLPSENATESALSSATKTITCTQRRDACGPERALNAVQPPREWRRNAKRARDQSWWTAQNCNVVSRAMFLALLGVFFLTFCFFLPASHAIVKDNSTDTAYEVAVDGVSADHIHFALQSLSARTRCSLSEKQQISRAVARGLWMFKFFRRKSCFVAKGRNCHITVRNSGSKATEQPCIVANEASVALLNALPWIPPQTALSVAVAAVAAMFIPFGLLYFFRLSSLKPFPVECWITVFCCLVLVCAADIALHVLMHMGSMAAAMSFRDALEYLMIGLVDASLAWLQIPTVYFRYVGVMISFCFLVMTVSGALQLLASPYAHLPSSLKDIKPTLSKSLTVGLCLCISFVQFTIQWQLRYSHVIEHFVTRTCTTVGLALVAPKTSVGISFANLFFSVFQPIK